MTTDSPGIAAVTKWLRGDHLAAEVDVYMMTPDELSDLANDLDDFRAVIDHVPDPEEDL